MKRHHIYFIIVSILGFLIINISCDWELQSPFDNEPPTTRLANIPVEGDTLFPLVTLHWDGADPDGFVVGYEYRYITTYLYEGDVVEHDWVYIENTSETITFDSADLINQQRFQVRAIDNDGVKDPEPAERVFYTYQAKEPHVAIEYPQNNQKFFALENTSDWWRGIPLRFTAWDDDGEIVEYGYAINDNEWIWTGDTLLYLTPEQFTPSLEGTHTIRVTARNNLNLINEEGATVAIQLLKPTFDKKVLIINETDTDNWGGAVRATKSDVQDFYTKLFAHPDPNMWAEWDYYQMDDMPSKDILGRYELVIWHADNRPTSHPHAFADSLNVEALMDYLNVGGDLIMSGWRMLKSFAWPESFPQSFVDHEFISQYLQIIEVDETPLLGDMTGALGVNGFSDVQVDSTKLDFFPNRGTLNNVNLITQRGGFTEVILSYESSMDSQFPQYRGRPVGLIYYGTSFNITVLGFPLFFILEDDAVTLSKEILQRMEYDYK